MRVLSSIPGRVRVAHIKFKDKHILDDMVHCLEQIDGIDSVVGQVITGNILIHYDHNVVKELDLMTDFFEDFRNSYIPKEKKKKPFRFHKGNRLWRDALHGGMLTTLIISIYTAYYGRKKTHIKYGWLFILFALEHSRINRKLLLK